MGSLCSAYDASMWNRKCPEVKLPKNPLDGPYITQTVLWIQSPYTNLLYTSGETM